MIERNHPKLSVEAPRQRLSISRLSFHRAPQGETAMKLDVLMQTGRRCFRVAATGGLAGRPAGARLGDVPEGSGDFAGQWLSRYAAGQDRASSTHRYIVTFSPNLFRSASFCRRFADKFCPRGHGIGRVTRLRLSNILTALAPDRGR